MLFSPVMLSDDFARLFAKVELATSVLRNARMRANPSPSASAPGGRRHAARNCSRDGLSLICRRCASAEDARYSDR
jgi:hypothetical protein